MKLVCAVLFAALAMSPVEAKEEQPPARAHIFQRLVDCRSVAEAAARLACFDREVAVLDAAESAKSVVILDKEQVRDARRTLFGLALPSLKLFGGGGEGDEVAQIESKVASAREDADGWTIGLADGSVWRQIDARPFSRRPKAGLDAVVKRASLGSFMMRVEGAPGVRVKRIL